MSHTQVLIQGSGIVAHVAALSLARLGLEVALSPLRPTPGHSDVRAYAINAASRRLLDSLKVWQAMPEHAACAVQAMHVQADDGSRIEFDAPTGEQALSWIVDVPALEATLRDALRFAQGVRTLAEGESASADLTLICEGRTSATRTRLGVEFDISPYGHTAIAARLHTEQPHGRIARQWFGQPHRGDVLALLPLDSPDTAGRTGHTHALVWSMQSAHVNEYLGMADADFEQALLHASTSDLGDFKLCSSRLSWPLQSAVAHRVTGPGWVLLGDAAHNMHPLAGQGLNLGLADVHTLSQVLAGREAHRSPADARLLRRYERERSVDVSTMTWGNDALWRIFGHSDSRVQTLRQWGIRLFNNSPVLKSWTMRRAAGL